MDGWKTQETHFDVESTCLAVNAGYGLLRHNLDVQSLLRKSAALFSTRSTKVLDVSSSKRPSAGAKNGKR